MNWIQNEIDWERIQFESFYLIFTHPLTWLLHAKVFLTCQQKKKRNSTIIQWKTMTWVIFKIE